MIRRAPLVLGISFAACSTYGWADRGGSGAPIDRPVAVRTIAVDAHAGADAASLTELLVQEMRRAGVGSAAWTAATQDRDIVECRVRLVRDEGFGQHASVETSTECFVDELLVATRGADSVLATGDAISRSRAVDLAVRSSMPAVANDLAVFLRTSASQANRKDPTDQAEAATTTESER